MDVQTDALTHAVSASEELRPETWPDTACPRLSEIQDAVCRWYRVSRTDMLSHRRERSVARPRQIGMYLARHLTTRSYPEIGRFFGKRDHTTAMHAARTIERLKEIDAEMTADISLLRLSIAMTMKARMRREAAL